MKAAGLLALAMNPEEGYIINTSLCSKIVAAIPVGVAISKTLRAGWPGDTRAREEIPGAWVDTSGRATFRERVDPSSEALELEDAFERFAKLQDLELRTRIVWLVEPPTGLAGLYENVNFDEEAFDGGGWEFEQQEAILIPGYLGRYEAFLMVDHNARAPLDGENA